MILSYHPPIFVPMKRLTQSSWKERIVVRCAENRVAIYSPHTSYDAVQGGVNDWLLKPFGGKCPVWFAVYSWVPRKIVQCKVPVQTVLHTVAPQVHP